MYQIVQVPSNSSFQISIAFLLKRRTRGSHQNYRFYEFLTYVSCTVELCNSFQCFDSFDYLENLKGCAAKQKHCKGVTTYIPYNEETGIVVIRFILSLFHAGHPRTQ